MTITANIRPGSSQQVAIDALQKEVKALRLDPAYSSGTTGTSTAPAPVPLTGAEWAAVQDSETPKMRAILGEDLGVLSSFAKLDPSNRDILANVFVTEKDGGVEVSPAGGPRTRPKSPARPAR